MLYNHIPLDPIQEGFGKRKVSRATVQVPKRIKRRWFKEADNKSVQHRISGALETVGISRKEFYLCWKKVKPKIPDDELFSLLNKAFGTPRDHAAKDKFVRDVWRRYKAMGERVRLSVCLSVCHASSVRVCALWVYADIQYLLQTFASSIAHVTITNGRLGSHQLLPCAYPSILPQSYVGIEW